MLGWIATAVEKAAEITAKTVVKAAELPLKCGQAVLDGIEKATTDKDDRKQ